MKKSLDAIFTMLRKIYREQKKQTKILKSIENKLEQERNVVNLQIPTEINGKGEVGKYEPIVKEAITKLVNDENAKNAKRNF
ncbi:hypothetical protein P7H60_06455 [Vagococcus carniphilus]|uniref:hypothetical protein n=1 Tax=Vagococcus carniphilus TaxID=218144 RepID=UPI00288FE6EF|nr:hypothetical protein [Vagococcus carniphilus]MDT2848798.1 hypothetical protein [Vagococcus carniphilus]